MREDLISSAISFLSDPKVQDAPLAKKVSFLESKGMTADEIEEAMARVNGKSNGSAQVAGASTGALVHQPMMMQAPPPVPARPSYDWKDIFIAAVLAGGFGYGVWTLAKRLYGTWFQVPNQKELDEEKEKLDAQFQAVEDSLKDIREQTNSALATASEQSKKVDESINNLGEVLEELKKNDEERDTDFNDIKKDLDILKNSVSKSLENDKNSQNAALVELQNEMKSLKSFMLNRREPTSNMPSNSTTASPVSTPNLDGIPSRFSATFNSNNRTSIPAWQLASNNSTEGTK